MSKNLKYCLLAWMATVLPLFGQGVPAPSRPMDAGGRFFGQPVPAATTSRVAIARVPAQTTLESPPALGAAADVSTELAQLRTRMATLEGELRSLKAPAGSKGAASKEPGSGVEADKTEKGSGSSDTKSQGKAGDQKPSDKDLPKKIDVDDKKWTVKLGGHVQMEYINWAYADPDIPAAQDYFEFRRLRLVADGTGYGVYDFRLQMTLEPEEFTSGPGTQFIGTPEVKDAYASMNEIPWLGRVRIGNFFVPFGLEQVTNDTNNIFLERSIPTQGIFTPDREVGIASYTAGNEQYWTISNGIFLDSISESIKERIDDNQGYRLSSRFTWLPFYDEASKGRYLLHVGTGVLYTDDQDGRIRIRARPQIHEGPRLVDTGSLFADQQLTTNIEGALVWGQFTVQSEAYLSRVGLTAARDQYAYGAYVHGSYFLTGENRRFEKFGQHGAQFGRNVPNNNFYLLPGRRSWGAWELKGRWSYLDLANLNAGQYNDFTFGVNWYFTDRMRIMFDWIHPITSSGALFGSTQSDLLAIRYDVNW